MKYKCKFCDNKIKSNLIVHNYNDNKNNGIFYECDLCEVIIQPNQLNNLYDTQESSNYNLNKNLFYYLKQFTLLHFIYNLRKIFKKKTDILDYGCGSGELAATMSEIYKDKNIFTSDVFDLDKKFIPKIKQHFLSHKGQLIDKKFDIIIMRHVFEHVFDLNIFLKEIKKNFKNKESCLVMEVPNKNSFWRKIMKKRWPGYFYPFHYYVFSKKFLKNIFINNGLEIFMEKKSEPPVVGSYFLTYGINKSVCKLLSIIFYPFQFMISKIFFSSEAILLIIKKK